MGHTGGLGPNHPAVKALMKTVDGLPPHELFDACREIEDPRRRKGFSDYVVTHLADSAPMECLEFIGGEPAENQPNLVSSLFRKWAKNSPSEAVDWFLGKEFEEGPLFGNAITRDALIAHLARTVAGTGAIDEAVTLAEGLNGSDRQRAAISGILSRAKGAELQSFADNLLAKIGDSLVRIVATEQIGEKLAKDDLEVGKNWALGQQTSDDQAAFEAASRGVATSWLRRDPKNAADWWLSYSDHENREQVYSEIIGAWAKSAPNEAGIWLGQQPQNRQLDLARATFARAVLEQDPESAAAWANAIEDEHVRLAVLREMK